MAHQHYRTRGFVLAKKNSGEADQIFVLYTQDFGKIEVAGKSIRKITSKLKSSIDIFYFIEMEFIQGKSRKTLTDAVVIDKFLELRKDPEALACFWQISEAISRLMRIEKKDEEIWQLLVEVSQKINNYKLLTINYKLISHYFLWNFFSLLGYSPELYTCPVCSQKLLPETFFLSPRHGGVICWRCCDKAKKENQQFLFSEITVNTVKLIRFLVKQPLERAQRITSCQSDLQDLIRASDLYFDFLVEG